MATTTQHARCKGSCFIFYSYSERIWGLPVYLFQVFIGLIDCLRPLWLAKLITSVLVSRSPLIASLRVLLIGRTVAMVIWSVKKDDHNLFSNDWPLVWYQLLQHSVITSGRSNLSIYGRQKEEETVTPCLATFFSIFFYDKSYSSDTESIWQSAFGDEPYVLDLTWVRLKAKQVATVRKWTEICLLPKWSVLLAHFPYTVR